MNIVHLRRSLSIDKDLMQAPNLTSMLTKEDLSSIGQATWEGYDRDKQSRIKWETRMEAGMDLAMQIQNGKTFPWPGCANVVFPLVTIAALQFSARAYSNIVSGTDVVKYRVAGADPEGKIRAKADRISRHMSWQVLEEDSSWEEQHDRLLINLAIVGTNFIKTYYSPSLAHNVSELVLARDFVLDYYAKSVEACARKTQVLTLYRNEIYERVKSGAFRDVLDDGWFNSPAAPDTRSAKQDNRLGRTSPQVDADTPFRALEQHRLLDLDGDGYAEPYIVTIEEKSKEVLRIVARFDREEDIERTSSGAILRIRPTEYFTKYSFIPAPDGGVYDVGFGILLGPLNEAVNSGINQLIDSGTMQNSMGGFLGRGAKIRGGVYTMAPWEWKRVDSTGDDLRKSMVPFPERTPSTVTFQLLSLLINYTDRIAGTVDQMVGENPGQNTPAETSRNMVEQGSQVFNMIFKRVWRSMKEEFKKLHRLNATYLPMQTTFGAEGGVILQEDYKTNPDLVVPVADPSITSTAIRLAQADALRMAAHTVPGYSIPVVEKRFLQALKIDGIDEVYPGPDKVPPLPNPKMQLEEMKLKGKAMDHEAKNQQFAQKLMEDRRKNNAEIALLYAQAEKILSEVGVAKAAEQLKAFDIVIEALQRHNEMINERLQTIMGGKDGDSNAGGVQRVAAKPGDEGVPGAAGGMAGVPQGPMGGGLVPGQGPGGGLPG